MKHAIIILIVILAIFSCISAEQIGALEGYLIPDGLYVDKDHFYITEGPVISIHSMKDLSLLDRFGKIGEGPGEFIGRIFPDASGPEILVSSQGRVSFFSKQGKCPCGTNLRQISCKLTLTVSKLHPFFC